MNSSIASDDAMWTLKNSTYFINRVCLISTDKSILHLPLALVQETYTVRNTAPDTTVIAVIFVIFAR